MGSAAVPVSLTTLRLGGAGRLFVAVEDGELGLNIRVVVGVDDGDRLPRAVCGLAPERQPTESIRGLDLGRRQPRAESRQRWSRPSTDG